MSPVVLLNRVAAATQAAAIAITVTTANRPIDLGWVSGPWSSALGWAAVTAALTALIHPDNRWTEGALAGLCTTFWAVRSLDLGIDWVSTPTLATAVAVHLALAIHTALFAYRTIVRLGFYTRFDSHPVDA